MLSAALASERTFTFADCMRKARRRDAELREVLERASAKCRKGLQEFYCERVVALPKIFQSPPMERYCDGPNSTTGLLAPPDSKPSVDFELVPASGARIAFFILAFGYQENIGRLLLQLVRVAHRVLVHIDVKRPTYFESLQRWVQDEGLKGVDVISKYRVNRGGVSTLHAWLGGVAWLLQNGGDWDYFINLNDSDYPISSLASLGRFLWLNHGGSFINMGSTYKDCDCGRYLVYECGDELYSIAPSVRYPRRPQLEHASGPNLFTASRALAEYVVRNKNVTGSPVQQVFADLSILQQPDEKFFQTMIINSPLCWSHVQWAFHIWDRPGIKADESSPEVAGPELKMLTPPLLSEAFWPRLMEVKQRRMTVFFARKFDNNRTVALQDSIDAAVGGASGDFGVEASGWRRLKRDDAALPWLDAISSAFLGPSAEASNAAVWREDLLADGVYFTVARYRRRVQLPCARPSVAGLDVASRSGRCRGFAVLEELGARSAYRDAESRRALPRIGALRVGSGWSRETLDFRGAVSILPADQADEATVVIYWTLAAAREFADMGEQEMEVEWQAPDGQRTSKRSGLSPNSMVSWSTRGEMDGTPGEWRVEVRLHGTPVGARTFHVCRASCAELGSEVAQRYFRIAPARG